LEWTGATEIAHDPNAPKHLTLCLEPWSRFTPSEYGEMVKANFLLFAAAPEMLAMLEDLEWRGTDHDERDNRWECCPDCGAPAMLGQQRGQHRDRCELIKIIRKAKGEA
jgi:hypothetical protein